MSDDELRDWVTTSLSIRINTAIHRSLAFGEEYRITVDLMLAGRDYPISTDYATIDFATGATE